jgi:alkanesulfonate monooxygenase SsuD/methylene tetrahydromethanopterin reductase-like flavin-dependent oxidoreductase (luciferase family)
VLGFGVGGDQSLAPFGLEVERPVALIRDALRIARGVLSGRSTAGYEVALHAAPAREVPLYVASRGEQINRLAAQEADGVFISGFAPGALDTVLGWVRTAGSPRVALYQSVRFRPGDHDDPTSITGTPAVLATRLVELVERHRPDSIGVALVDGDDVVTMAQQAIETLRPLTTPNG